MPSLPETQVVAQLRSAGCVFAEDEARLLVAAAATDAELGELLQRRISGLPLELVLGWAEFCGHRVAVEPGVFVPRRRTELLVELAVAVAPPHAVVVDLCCGTGALAVALAARRPDAELHAADIDPAAIRCARRNLRTPVHLGDLFDALPASLRGRLDVLVVNAPYVPTEAIALMPPEAREHEARVALDGGPDGLDLHRRVIAGAPEWLRAGGHLVIETSVEQADRTAALATAAGLQPEVHRSEESDGTAVVARHGG